MSYWHRLSLYSQILYITKYNKKYEIHIFSTIITSFFFLFIEEKPLNIDPVVTERLLLHRLESIDEWSLDGDLNPRRTSLDD